MLKKHSQVFLSLLFAADLLTLAAAWILAYFLRFHAGLFTLERGVPPLETYLALLPFALAVWAVALRVMGLYQPRRSLSLVHEFWDLIKASTLATMVLILVTFFYREESYSRIGMVLFWGTSTALLALTRGAARETLRVFRRRGYNLRYLLIVGAGELGRRLLERVRDNPWLGLRVVGFLDEAVPEGTSVAGVPVLGGVKRLKEVLRRHAVDQVIFALPIEAHGALEAGLSDLADETVDIKLIPDVLEYLMLNAGVEDLDGLPIVNLSASPLYGWDRVVKRLADSVLSLGVLTATAPLWLLIAAAIKLTSPGPVFFRQERMGLGGEVFLMLKFRTMVAGAEEETGPVWAQAEDPRRTRVGVFLRRTSLDELPQFWNVLKGEMSIVGPRPERPVFIGEFKQRIPRYMLRHKVKAGITGWAQVNGLRGNTSIEKRLEYDLYYLEHWSLAFDLKIMWLTIWKGLIHRNAY